MKLAFAPVVMKCVVVCALSLALASCATSEKLPPAPRGYVLVHDYVDSTKTATGDQYQRIEMGWSYDEKSAVRTIYSLDGKLLSRETMPAVTLRATDAEMEFAYALVRAEPSLQKQVRRKDAMFQGGFSLREPGTPCGEGSRCVHVMISDGIVGHALFAHAIVDLASGKIVEKHYEKNSFDFPQANQQ
jgi:hypothetical protein